jgi:hypothetical protein
MSGSCAAAIPGLNTADKVSAMADTHERAGRSLGISSPWLNVQTCKGCIEADESARISGNHTDKQFGREHVFSPKCKTIFN